MLHVSIVQRSKKTLDMKLFILNTFKSGVSPFKTEVNLTFQMIQQVTDFLGRRGQEGHYQRAGARWHANTEERWVYK